MRFFSKLTTLFAILFFVSSIILWIVVPFLIDFKVKQNLNLANTSTSRAIWEKSPIPIDFKVYLFNITNYKEVTNGAKPILREIGPYIYDEWKEKTVIDENDKKDTIDFHMKNTYIFNPEKSKDLTGDEIVIIPHPLIIMPSLTLVAAKQEAMLPTFSKAIKILLNDPKDPFLKVSVKNILFDGIHVNCTVSDPEVKMVCKMLKSELKEVTNETLNFSLFGAKNNTDLPGLLTVKRGVKIFRQTGRVVQFNGQTKLNVWGPKGTCNSILGTDSTIFPPFQPDDEEIYTFSPDICTSLQSKLQKKIMYKGVLVGRYNTSLGDMSHNKDQKCYCPAKNYCLKRGAIDITKCVNSTLVVTLPHFYDADVSYLRAVSGLNPNEESHGTYMNFEMNTGSPVYAVKRLQFNIPIRPIKTMFLMENFSDILLPIFWIEESIELNETYVKSFRSLHKVIKIADIVKWSATTLFGGGLFISVVMMYVVEVLSFDKERYNEQNSPDFSSDETTPRELSAK